MKPAKPDVISAKLADTIQILAGVEDRYRWLYAASYSPTRYGTTEGQGKGGHSDPTAGAALDEWNGDVRHSMGEACKFAVEAHRSALKAYRALAQSEEREPDHPYAALEQAITDGPTYRDAQDAQARRAKRGATA